MTPEQHLVMDFQEQFGRELNTKPCIPAQSTIDLRANLIFEECKEVLEALGYTIVGYNRQVTLFKIAEANICIAPLAKELADLHYVAYCGTGAAFGIDMEPVFKEVHRSNMTKWWNFEEADLYCSTRKNAIVKTIKGKHYVIENGKIIKPPLYEPANITPIIVRQIQAPEL